MWMYLDISVFIYIIPFDRILRSVLYVFNLHNVRWTNSKKKLRKLGNGGRLSRMADQAKNYYIQWTLTVVKVRSKSLRNCFSYVRFLAFNRASSFTSNINLSVLTLPFARKLSHAENEKENELETFYFGPFFLATWHSFRFYVDCVTLLEWIELGILKCQ